VILNLVSLAGGTVGWDNNGVFSLIHFGSRGLGLGEGGSVGSLER